MRCAWWVDHYLDRPELCHYFAVSLISPLFFLPPPALIYYWSEVNKKKTKVRTVWNSYSEKKTKRSQRKEFFRSTPLKCAYAEVLTGMVMLFLLILLFDVWCRSNAGSAKHWEPAYILILHTGQIYIPFHSEETFTVQ